MHSPLCWWLPPGRRAWARPPSLRAPRPLCTRRLGLGLQLAPTTWLERRPSQIGTWRSLITGRPGAPAWSTSDRSLPVPGATGRTCPGQPPGPSRESAGLRVPAQEPRSLRWRRALLDQRTALAAVTVIFKFICQWVLWVRVTSPWRRRVARACEKGYFDLPEP